MDFHFSVYSTPLLFGFVQAWIYGLLLWQRGLRQERLADLLLGGVLVALAFEVWVYMLGFAGIEALGVLAIALDCGFNSKATFNRVFRQLAGESPKQFIKRKRPGTRAGGG